MASSVAFAGYEIILIFYPFVINKNRVLLAASLGNLATVLTYLIVALVSTMFFSVNDVMKNSYTTLLILQVAETIIIERIQSILLAFWVLKVLGVAILMMWAGAMGTANFFPAKDFKTHVIIGAIVVFILGVFPQTQFQVEAILGYLGNISLIINIPLVFSLLLLRKIVGESKRSQWIKIILIIVIIIITLICTGCWDLKTVEESGLLFSVGLDINDEGNLIISTTSPVFEKEVEEKVEILTVTADTLMGGGLQLDKTGGRVYILDKLQAIVISEELAKQRNIMELLDIFYRGTDARVNADLLISKTTAREVLNIKMKDKPRIGIYLPNLIKASKKVGQILPTKLFMFRQIYFDPGRDATVPLLDIKDNNLNLIGLATLKGGSMVGELNHKEKQIFLLLMEKGLPQIFVKYKGDRIGFTPEKIKSKITPQFNNDSFNFHIKLIIKGTINEVFGKPIDLSDMETIKDIEKSLNTQLKKEITSSLKKFQEQKSDILGLGKIIRTSRRYNKYWKQIDWDEEYPRVTFDVKVESTIQRAGALK